MTSPVLIILHYFDPLPFSEKIRLASGSKKIPRHSAHTCLWREPYISKRDVISISVAVA